MTNAGRFAAALLALSCTAHVASAQSPETDIVLNGPLQPYETDLGGGATQFEIGEDHGTRPGGGVNLLQDVQTYILGEGDVGLFTADGALTTDNIVVKVDGGLPTEIWGTLATDVDGASLYFLNPAGIFVGETGALDVKGSFHASTADSLLMQTPGGVTLPAFSGDPALATAHPSAFGFDDVPTGVITIEGATLETPEGFGLSLVGGPVQIGSTDTAVPQTILSVKNGRLSVASAGAAGEIEITDHANGLELSLDPADDGGRIDVDRAQLRLEGPGEISLAAGTVDLFEPDPPEFDSAPEIRSIADPGDDAPGGDIVIHATTLVLNGARIFSISDSGDRDTPGGSIMIVAESITLENTARIEATASSESLGGEVDIRAGDAGNLPSTLLSLSGESVITTDSDDFAFNSTEPTVSGDVHIRDFDRVELSGLSQIRSDATGRNAQSGDLRFEGIGTLALSERSEISSGVFQQANRSFDDPDVPDGNGRSEPGSVFIEADTIDLQSGGSIESISASAGNGGNIEIDARIIKIDGAYIDDTPSMFGGNLTQPSGISATIGFGDDPTSGAFTTSHGGSILIHDGEGRVEQIQITNGGRIGAESVSSGFGGTIEIHADRILVSGFNQEIADVLELIGLPEIDPNFGSVLLQIGREEDFAHSAIAANAILVTEEGSGFPFQEGGPAGSIELHVGTLEVTDQGLIVAFTEGVEDAGGIVIEADESVLLSLAGQIGTDTSLTDADFFSSPPGGAAGQVRISAPLLRLTDDSEISSDVEQDATGHGGSVFIDADRIELIGTAEGTPEISTDTEGAGAGGDLLIVARQELLIDTVAGEEAGGIFANSKFDDGGMGGGGTGDAGSIFIAARRLRMSGGTISASTEGSGAGGSVVIGSSDDFPLPAGIDPAEVPTQLTRSVGLTGGAEISVRSSGTGSAGDVVMDVAGRLHVENSAITTQADQAFGGNVDIAARVVDVLRGEITARTDATGAGDGGNVTIRAPSMAFNEAKVTASAVAGNGGNILLIAGDALISSAPTLFEDTGTRGTVFDATSDTGLDGTVALDSPDVNLDSGLATLATDFLDASKLIRPSCEVAAGDGAGSFRVSSRRGIPASPEELLVAFGERSVPEAGDVPEVQQVAMRGVDAAALRSLGAEQQAQGDYAASVESLRGSLALAEQAGDTGGTARALGSLGDALLALGRSEEAESHLSRGIQIAVDSEQPGLASELLNSLGNHHAVRRDHAKALDAYERSAAAAEQAGRTLDQARALANAARAAQAAGDTGRARSLLAASRTRLARVVDDDPRKIPVWIHLAKTYERFLEAGGTNRQDPLAAQKLLASASVLANRIGDDRGLGYAFINLGSLYRREGHLDEALYLTREGLAAAERAEAPDLVYRAHWQAGRIHWAKGDRREGLVAYRKAVRVLEESRQETLARYGSAEVFFRRQVAPVYLDLVDALLQTSGIVSEEAAQSFLREARGTVELLKAAELRDYFQNECVAELESRSTSLDEVSAKAAVVYPVLLPDRIEVLVSVGGRIRRSSTTVASTESEETIRDLRRALSSPGETGYQAPAGRLYDWLIRPFEGALADAGIETLVFVPGGALRTVPMSVLYDGERYLVERFALAVTPSLDVIDPRPMDPAQIELLAAGVSKSVRGAPALPAVPRELETVKGVFGGRSYLDEAFRVDALADAIATSRPSIVHIASHGLFTGDPKTSFLLAYDAELTMDRLADVIGVTRFREEPLELLVMSACQTAAGDERAALGLAGVAIRAGARSAIGSLWNISDDAAYDLIDVLYQELARPGMSRARALQRAQLGLLRNERFAHPYYWSPFLLINDWL